MRILLLDCDQIWCCVASGTYSVLVNLHFSCSEVFILACMHYICDISNFLPEDMLKVSWTWWKIKGFYIFIYNISTVFLFFVMFKFFYIAWTKIRNNGQHSEWPWRRWRGATALWGFPENVRCLPFRRFSMCTRELVPCCGAWYCKMLPTNHGHGPFTVPVVYLENILYRRMGKFYSTWRCNA